MINCNITISEAEKIFKESSIYQKSYADYLTIYKRVDTKALWLYWFARNVIHDHWPAAEPIISENYMIQSGYQAYLNILRQCSYIGSSLKQDLDYEIGPDGKIISRRERIRKRVTSLCDVESLADSIANEMAIDKLKNKNY